MVLQPQTIPLTLQNVCFCSVKPYVPFCKGKMLKSLIAFILLGGMYTVGVPLWLFCTQKIVAMVRKGMMKRKKRAGSNKAWMRKHGFPKLEIWNTNNTIARLVVPRLKAFRALDKHGYPPCARFNGSVGLGFGQDD